MLLLIWSGIAAIASSQPTKKLSYPQMQVVKRALVVSGLNKENVLDQVASQTSLKAYQFQRNVRYTLHSLSGAISMNGEELRLLSSVTTMQ